MVEKGQGGGEYGLHLGRGGAHGVKALGGDQAQHRPQQKARLIADKVRRAQQGDLPGGDGQFLFRLPQGAFLGRFPYLHAAAGEAHLAALAEGAGAHFIEKM